MSSPIQSTPVDASRLHELRDLFGDDAEIASLYQEFFVELPDRMSFLTTSLRNGMPEGIERTAHAISGSSGSLGAMCVHRAAKSLEEKARMGEVDHLEDLMVLLQTELDRLRSYLKQEGLLGE
ncbi:MAG: Hpt domain-containing protein [Planctomycetes bacterium]|nr:Hpt domain-containing protein [Planctomycetota bacterium]